MNKNTKLGIASAACSAVSVVVAACGVRWWGVAGWAFAVAILAFFAGWGEYDDTPAARRTTTDKGGDDDRA